MPNFIKEIWDKLSGKPNPFDSYLMKWLANNAIYPSDGEETYLNSYTSNNDVFTVINKITEPASTIPIFQYDAKGEIVEDGKMLARLNKPNNYQSRSQFIEAALSFYYIFGNCYTAEETVENSLTGIPARLDILPPQWMSIILGTMFDPIEGYSFYPLGGTNLDYEREKIFHWKEFNPDYTLTGGHLKGMSRLKPLLKSITGSNDGYNSLVGAFQSQGMWGLLTMLDEPGAAKNLTPEQMSKLKGRFRKDSRKGELTIINSRAEYTKMGLTMVELEVLRSLGIYKGNLCDAYNVPSQLLSGSQDRTYNNFREAEQALWRNAIQPSLNAYLEGLSNWIAPKFKEEGNILKADYSEVACLQDNKAELVSYMVMGKCFTKDEIREACGYEMLGTPEMQVIYESVGLVPLSQISEPPDPEQTEEAMKQHNLSDYRK